MGKRKAKSASQTNNKKSSAEHPTLNNASASAPAPAPEVASVSGENELAQVRATLRALQGRFAQVMTEKKALEIQNEQLQSQKEELQERNKQQDIHLVQQDRELTYCRGLVKGLTFEVDELKTELAFFRSLTVHICFHE